MDRGPLQASSGNGRGTLGCAGDRTVGVWDVQQQTAGFPRACDPRAAAQAPCWVSDVEEGPWGESVRASVFIGNQPGVKSRASTGSGGGSESWRLFGFTVTGGIRSSEATGETQPHPEPAGLHVVGCLLPRAPPESPALPPGQGSSGQLALRCSGEAQASVRWRGLIRGYSPSRFLGT